MAFSRACFTVALLACMATAAIAGKCKQNAFCERWMCEQNANRRDLLKKALGSSYSLDLLDQCNNQQNANILATTCTLPGFGTFNIGMRYQVDTCAQEKPPQLLVVDPKTGVNAMAVQSKSLALIETNLSKTTEAEKIFQSEKAQCGTSGFKPSHPCVCQQNIAKDFCVARIRFDVFYDEKSPHFSQSFANRFAGEFVLRNSENNVNLGVVDVNGARPNALQNCVEHFGQAACDAISPAPVRRSRRRALIQA